MGNTVRFARLLFCVFCSLQHCVLRKLYIISSEQAVQHSLTPHPSTPKKLIGSARIPRVVLAAEGGSDPRPRQRRHCPHETYVVNRQIRVAVSIDVVSGDPLSPDYAIQHMRIASFAIKMTYCYITATSSSSSSDRAESRGPLRQPRVATMKSFGPFGTNAEWCTVADLLDP